MNIVVKLSSNLINPANAIDVVERIAKEAEILKKNGNQVVIVTSGAVMYGMKTLGLSRRPEEVPQLQSCASIGQIFLMKRFQETFAKYNLVPGEVLLSADDFHHRKRYLNLRNTIKTLLGYGAIPVINENDTINIEELKLGDNDHLSSLISIMLDFDQLIILTDVDGVYDRDPKSDSNAQLIKQIDKIDDGILSFASDKTSLFTTGGMKKKLSSADKATKAGICVFIGNGFKTSLQKIITRDEIGTYIMPSAHLSARTKWLAFSPSEESSIYIDEGAKKAIEKSSLLPSGITNISGAFRRGSLVSIYCGDEKIAQGLSNYSSEELELIKGKKSFEIKEIISDFYEEAIHKNNLYLLH